MEIIDINGIRFKQTGTTHKCHFSDVRYIKVPCGQRIIVFDRSKFRGSFIILYSSQPITIKNIKSIHISDHNNIHLYQITKEIGLPCGIYTDLHKYNLSDSEIQGLYNNNQLQIHETGVISIWSPAKPTFSLLLGFSDSSASRQTGTPITAQIGQICDFISPNHTNNTNNTNNTNRKLYLGQNPAKKQSDNAQIVFYSDIAQQGTRVVLFDTAFQLDSNMQYLSFYIENRLKMIPKQFKVVTQQDINVMSILAILFVCILALKLAMQFKIKQLKRRVVSRVRLQDRL